MFTAARLGFEPRYTDPESVVLPLDDLAALNTNKSFFTPNERRLYGFHTIRRSGNTSTDYVSDGRHRKFGTNFRCRLYTAILEESFKRLPLTTLPETPAGVVLPFLDLDFGDSSIW